VCAAPGVTLVSIAAAAAAAAADCVLQTPQRVRCSWNNVAPADTKVLQFTVKGAEAGTITNKASVSSTGNVAPKEATVDVTLQPETVPPVDKV
jgi:hypothetical protein